MKHTLHILFSCFFFVQCFGLSAQSDIHTNATGEDAASQATLRYESPVTVDTSMTQLPCGTDVFFTVDYSGTIHQHQLVGPSVMSLGPLTTRPGLRGLSINDNFDGGNPSPTFFSDSTSPANTLYGPRYYDATGWTTPSPAPAGMTLANPGGYGQYCYYMKYIGNTCTEIVRYDGISWNIIYTCPAGRMLVIADLGVDQNGNIVFLGKSTAAQMYCDSIYVISSTGQLLAQHPVIIHMVHAYGAMMMNGIYYVGFGSTNLTYPDKLVPFTITSSSLTIGIPIPFATPNHYDLASCEPGLITGIQSGESGMHRLRIWPVPASENISFESEETTVWEIYSADGKSAMNGTSNGITVVEIAALSPGLYILVLRNGEGEIRRARFMVE